MSGSNQPSEFEKAAQGKRRGVLAEMISFLVDNKKWWMLPLVLSLLLVGALVILGSTAAGPFIYTLF